MKAEPIDGGPMGAEGGPGAFQRGPAYRSLRSSMALFPRKDGVGRQVSKHWLDRRHWTHQMERFFLSPVLEVCGIFGLSTNINGHN